MSKTTVLVKFQNADEDEVKEHLQLFKEGDNKACFCPHHPTIPQSSLSIQHVPKQIGGNTVSAEKATTLLFEPAAVQA